MSRDILEKKVIHQQQPIDTKLSRGLNGNASYKLVDYFDMHKTNEAAKVEEHLDKEPYVGMVIDNGIVAIYRTADRSYKRKAHRGELSKLTLGSVRFVEDELTPYAIDTMANFISRYKKRI